MMKKQPNQKGKTMQRRDFLKGSAMSAASFMIVPRHVLGGKGFKAPSDTVNIAAIGAGGMGASNMSKLTSQNIVALADCDHDWVRKSVSRDDRSELRAAYEKAKWYKDFREMLDKQKDIDAVVIATPDHVHAAAANTAMKMGKHVYVQKPLTYTVHESRVLRKTAKESGVVTQMGNQGHSNDDARLVNEWVQAGAIGPVREVHVWTNRPIWPQGMDRPEGKAKVPKDLAWDVFLGPAPYVEYSPEYHPFAWRGWTDYGVGALGDMGAHLIDHPYWALGLDYPDTVEASSTPWGGKDNSKVSYPLSTSVTYTFPARGMYPEVKMHWYDGGVMPARPAVLPDEVKLDRGGGVIFVGEKGILMHETYGSNPQMYPQSLMEEYADTPQTYKRVETSHEMNWVEAILGNTEAVSPFDYAAPLNETMLLGVVALHAPGETLRYDSEKMEFTNNKEVNQHLSREYRDGWTLA
ncbi:Gfo/Idh/MocA family protein [Catalinimonas niigatensis]|uniref:Gfo/Idh/MocA family protein n=1 Tax=Catalinimonas niigatensis TaxID=1397264 RepID=UPI00266614C3|nr:Gfo/Idh/MocA family oxidoreductase [Catalinimonas niigatensis]WPP49894.1 Gfo/Idh/MocA family oxidoreductase [Catalinimonas niigatensis]